MINKLTLSYKTYLWIGFIAVVMMRLFFLGAYPLADTTEARYGEMARLIIDTGDWITPQISKGIPFWGKPPLSFWLTAISFKAFGIHEFSARLPSLLTGLTVMFMIWHLCSFQSNRQTALLAAAILTSSVLFWISIGAVMTDHCLLAGTTLCMVSFWRAVHTSDRSGILWGYGFFIGLAIGLMAKGPIAAVLVFMPVVLWVVFQRKFSVVLQKLPWISGVMLTIILTVPWYWMAEIKTPGFLEYFLVGEHWNRFLVPGWEGDLYGSAHSRPRGTIWLYWIGSTFPWSFILAYFLVKNKSGKMVRSADAPLKTWYVYLILWTTAPMIIFTMAGNILATYVLPGLPAFSLLAADILKRSDNRSDRKVIKAGLSAMLTLFSIASILVAFGTGPAEKSQKALIQFFNAAETAENDRLFYLYKRPFSAEFYSEGRAQKLDSDAAIESLKENNQTDYLAVHENKLSRLSEAVKLRFIHLRKINRYYLLKEKR